MRESPPGVQVFLFTDIEGSTRRWEDPGSNMASALAQHDALLTTAVRDGGGRIFKHLGDGVAAVFESTHAAAGAALGAQRLLQEATWPPGCELRVRMGIHAGTAIERGGDYFGSTINRAARLMSAGHGSQILISGEAVDLIDPVDPRWEITPQGLHHLRDLAAPMTVFQLGAEGLPQAFPPLRTLDAYPSNLPRHLPSFTGRDELITTIGEELGRLRLVTVVGPAGIGKTRLAQQIAAEALPYHSSGVWFVDLSAVSSEESIVSAIAATTDVQTRSSERWSEAFAGEFASRQIVLVLDNCEQVVDGAASVVAELLRVTKDCRVLVTSRQPLGLPGEIVHRVDELSPAAAIDLFCERAAAARGSPTFDVDDPAVAELCVHLDGVPLAIELAAARARALSPAEILARIDQRFRLLRSSGRGADRHHTLEEAIRWSYELLPDSERLLLDRLGVFARTFDLDAVETVCAVDDLDRWEILDLLEGLVEKSFVVVENDGHQSRYRLLEMISDYALACLGERNEVGLLRDRHARYFVEWGQRIARRIQGGDLNAGTVAIRSQIDDLRQAFDWMRDRGWYQEMVELLRDLKVFYTSHAHAEGLRRHEEFLEVGDAIEPKLRVELLVGAARICVQSGMFRRADALLDEAERFSQEIGVSWPSDLIYLRAMIADMDGRPGEVMRHCAELLSTPEARADTFLDLLARIRMVAAMVFAEPAEAEAFATDTLERAERFGSDLLVAAAQLTFGLVHLVVTERFDLAERAFGQTIDISGEALPSASVPARVGVAMVHLDDDPLGALATLAEALLIESAGSDDPVSRACCYDLAAAACAALGDVERARVLLMKAQHLRELCGFGAWRWTWSARARAKKAVLGGAGASPDAELSSAQAIELVRSAMAQAAGVGNNTSEAGSHEQ